MPSGARTAAVFQEDRLIEHFSAARNVRLTAPASVPDEQIRAALSELGLADEGEKRVSEFSGGMRRRVAVIRAALFQPQFLLLDEPFKGLDEEMRARTAAFLRRNCAQAVSYTHLPPPRLPSRPPGSRRFPASSNIRTHLPRFS